MKIRIRVMDFHGVYRQSAGLEVSLNAAISASLPQQLGATIVIAELTEDQPFVDEGEDCGFDGDSIPNIPELQGYAALICTQETAPGELILRGDWTYRDDVDIRFDTASSMPTRCLTCAQRWSFPTNGKCRCMSRRSPMKKPNTTRLPVFRTPSRQSAHNHEPLG